ncbi:MAG: dihydrodipicolinate synthase family protein [Fimbriimonadia bacterium]|jgi:dihydrodipicolinate synthase/N-acetylneuraminate lyase
MAEVQQREPEVAAPAGIWSVLATPFDAKGEADYGALHAEVQWLAELGVRGVIVNGVTSEAHKLSHEERCLAAETVRAALPDGTGLVIGILEPSYPLIRSAANRAGVLEPDAVMVWPGFSPVVNAKQFEAMQNTAAEASGAPVIMQDAAFFGPPPLQPEDIAAAIDRNEWVCGVKVEAPRSIERMQAIQQRLERPVMLIGGQGGRFMPLEYEVGARAFFIGPGFPDLYLSVLRELEANGDLAHSWRRLVPLLDFMFQSAEFATACYKRLMVERGVFINAKPRAPGATLLPIEEKYLLRLGHELGLL